MDALDVEIRELRTIEDLRQCVALQFATWDQSDATPANQLIISIKTGGHVLAAYHEGRLVSFAYAFPAVLPGQEPWIASHLLATDKEYRGRGLGQLLKWKQREWALARGFRRITWTFDPLEAKNCHLNMNLLGAQCQEYIVNCYGELDDQLNRGLPTDRLTADWDLQAPHVAALAAGRKEAPWEPKARVAIHPDFQALKRQDLQEAIAIRMRVREELQRHLGAGLKVYGLDREASELLLR